MNSFSVSISSALKVWKNRAVKVWTNSSRTGRTHFSRYTAGCLTADFFAMFYIHLVLLRWKYIRPAVWCKHAFSLICTQFLMELNYNSSAFYFGWSWIYSFPWKFLKKEAGVSVWTMSCDRFSFVPNLPTSCKTSLVSPFHQL